MKKLNWEKCYFILKDFREKHGHLKISPTVPDYLMLKEWMLEQRTRQTSLKQEQIEQLLDLGFDFGPLQIRWYTQFFELRNYVRDNGHFPLSKKHHHFLPGWIEKLRMRRRKDLLTAFQISWLDTLDFEWNPKQRIAKELAEQWETWFQKLRDFIDQHGRLPRFSQCRGVEERRLASWINNQSKQTTFRDPVRIERLNALGLRVEKNRKEGNFNRRLEEMKAFKAKHGHCKVPCPRNFPQNPSLAAWVQYVRGRKIQLTTEQIRELNEIGFDWGSYSRRRWEKQYEKLVRYVKQHGCFPSRKRGQRGMEYWLQWQRQHKTNLTPDQRQKLKAIGFSLDPKKDQWEQKYRDLVRFHKRHGHCNVSGRHSKFGYLYSWLNHQRVRASSLSASQRKRLDALGWQMIRTITASK